MPDVSVVVRVLFTADRRWPTAVKSVNFDDGTLVVTMDTKIGEIRMVLVEKDENYHISDVSLTPKEKKA
ncbi:MAG TPA: hypothetical protein VFV38_04635 [Ktedonobacteraceae bacterium]|nr:hypothetical protein [Ktedonobacteraceae bacterium]